MEEVRPTRSELLDRRAQILLAEQGMDLLKQKRDALLIEFMSVMDETLHLSTTLQRVVADAQYSWSWRDRWTETCRSGRSQWPRPAT